MGSGELVGHGHGELVRPVAGALTGPAAGPSVSTAQVAFEGRVWTWSDVPAAEERAVRRRSVLVAEAAHLGEVAADRTGQQFQTLRAWRAHLDAVAVLVLVRPVVPGPDGTALPVGPWRRHQIEIRPTRGTPRRRTGVVPDDTDQPGPATAAPAPPVPVAQLSGSSAAAHLPAVVRSGMDRLVPAPVWWLGQLVQHTAAGGLPRDQELTTLRVDAARALVVTARRGVPPIAGLDATGLARALARVPWTVEQVQLDLSTGPGPIALPS
jgi:hypothetical protein